MKIEINVPNGKSNEWEVDEFEVKKNELSQQISMIKTGRGVPCGKYKKLTRGSVIVMSNTPDEIRDFIRKLACVKGNVLINGLGLGVTVKYLLGKKDITKITVIEKSKDVIKLVGPTYLKDNRVKIINADCFKYEPPKNERYNFVWHDIWDYITSDNLDEMKKLHRKYGRKTDAQASWCRYECEREKKRESYSYW